MVLRAYPKSGYQLQLLQYAICKTGTDTLIL